MTEYRINIQCDALYDKLANENDNILYGEWQKLTDEVDIHTEEECIMEMCEHLYPNQNYKVFAETRQQVFVLTMGNILDNKHIDLHSICFENASDAYAAMEERYLYELNRLNRVGGNVIEKELSRFENGDRDCLAYIKTDNNTFGWAVRKAYIAETYQKGLLVKEYK